MMRPPANNPPANPDRDCILLDHDLFDEVSNDLRSFRWGAIKNRCKTGRAIEHFPGWSLGMAVPKRSSSSAGLVSASPKT